MSNASVVEITSSSSPTGAEAVQDRLYPARPFLAASVAVFRGGRVLLAARGRGPMMGRYSLPGGLVESGETLAEAALRELREEVGVEAEIIAFVDHVEVIERDEVSQVKHHFVICAHAARWISGEPQTSPEALATCWVTEHELATLPTTPGLVGVLRKAFAANQNLG
jgi:ADP-ribose pyrophosphatase YjhB (NUDIX family)